MYIYHIYLYIHTLTRADQCVYEFVCVCIYVCISKYTCMCVYVWVCVCTYIYTYTYSCKCLYIYDICICVHICLLINTHTYIYMYTHAYIDIHVYIYLYIYIHEPRVKCRTTLPDETRHVHSACSRPCQAQVHAAEAAARFAQAGCLIMHPSLGSFVHVHVHI